MNIKRILFLLVTIGALIYLTAVLFTYGALESAPFFGEQPTDQQNLVSLLYYLGAAASLGSIYLVVRISKRIK
ncbi:MAG TPA: hypothetical protein VF597_02420 [Candidatus Saccharimonadales bacterium]|jgi:hypothetical protein